MRSHEAETARCDCRRVSLRNARLATVAALVCAFVVRAVAFKGGSPGYAVCGIVIGAALGVYGAVTIFDETATFPRPLYGVIAALGLALAALWTSRLL